MVEQSPQILVSEEKAHHHDLNYLRLKTEKFSCAKFSWSNSLPRSS